MIQDVITWSVSSLWPILSLILFLLCFLAIFFWTYRGRKDRFRREAALPLDDETSSDNSKGANHGQN